MEWLDFLVSEFDARNAIRAINHYERIDWIGESMRDHCYEVLQGIAEAEYPYRDESGPTDLTMDDHRQSLRYIENLATGHLDKELGDRITSLNTNGVQR
jgi:archaellum component FlaD/FlaE